MKERDVLDCVTARFGSDALRGLSFPADAELTLRLKTWTVPLSLETANHWAVEENAKL